MLSGGSDHGSLMRGLFLDPERWTNIPLLVKILKLIINELSNLLEASAARQAAPAEWSQDDANDMWEDQEEDDEEEDGLAGHLLSDILATGKHGMHPWAPGLVRAVSCPGPCPDPPCRCLWQRRTTMRMMRTMTLTP